MKPYSEACEQNKQVIFEVIQPYFAAYQSVLEIGSGTAQHAVFFARHMPQLAWQCSDVAENIAGIKLWLEEAQLPNLLEPLELDVDQKDWQVGKFDGVFSANTCHIMGVPQVEAMFFHIAQHLNQEGLFCCYGPFNDNGFTSDSNRRFDAWLKARDENMGIREISLLEGIAQRHHICLLEQIEMPVNNKILLWGNK